MSKGKTPKFTISGEFRDPEYGNLEMNLSKNGKKVRIRDQDTMVISEWLPVKHGSFYYGTQYFDVNEFVNLN